MFWQGLAQILTRTLGVAETPEDKAETIADERAALAESLANAPGWNVIED
jgi:hypothetical protein